MDGFTNNSLTTRIFFLAESHITSGLSFRRKKESGKCKKGGQAHLTKLQVDYWNMKVNEAMAAENERSHKANEAISRDTLSETVTHNRNTEAETQRHDIAGELETAQHNRNTEAITRDTLAETTRHDYETERNQRDITAENIRHDKKTEQQAFLTYQADKAIREEQNLISEKKADLEYEINRAKNDIAGETNDIRRRELENDFNKWNAELNQKYDQLSQQYELAIREQDVSKRNATLNAITTLINGSGKNVRYWISTIKDLKHTSNKK
jgi:MFS superfamily sulfate permease-like transporter